MLFLHHAAVDVYVLMYFVTRKYIFCENEYIEQGLYTRYTYGNEDPCCCFVRCGNCWKLIASLDFLRAMRTDPRVVKRVIPRVVGFADVAGFATRWSVFITNIINAPFIMHGKISVT